jgi:hypothetical protein
VVRTIIELRAAHAAALPRIVRPRGVSSARVIRPALGEPLARDGDGAALERARRAARSGASGGGDLAERRDDHLAEPAGA